MKKNSPAQVSCLSRNKLHVDVTRNYLLTRQKASIAKLTSAVVDIFTIKAFLKILRDITNATRISVIGTKRISSKLTHIYVQ